MKKNIHQLTLLLFCLGAFTVSGFSQWSASGTNIFNTNTGFVGIGTSAPGVTLHVNGTTNPAINLTAPVTGGTALLQTGVATCNGCYSSQAVIGDAVMRPSGPMKNVIFNLNTVNEVKTRSFTFTDDNGKIMQVWNGGQVQIGNVTTPGTYKLYVKGGILTEKVKVALSTSANWADYVFGKDYRLKPLSEVESFVIKNQHLPDMPSADQLYKEGGIDVNEMFAKQMEKIEELTLYIIEQNKQLEALKARIAQLEQK